MYVYIKSEKSCKDNDYHDLFTVGFYRPDGTWEPESDHTDAEEAAERVAWLNGSGESEPQSISEAVSIRARLRRLEQRGRSL